MRSKLDKCAIIEVEKGRYQRPLTGAFDLISAGFGKRNYNIINPSFLPPASNFQGGIFVKAQAPFLPTTPEQLKSLVKVDENGCWIYQKFVCRTTGYAKHNNKYIHRVSYEIFKGPIPKGLQIDHLCRVRNCVNPDHLEAVTHKENTLRGISAAANNARKTHCPKGHLYEESNLLGLNPYGRQCKTCHREGELLRKRAKSGHSLDYNLVKHCKNGHLRTPENTYIRPDTGHRMCKDCKVLSYGKDKK